MDYIYDNKEYDDLVFNILNNEEFKKLDNCRHHGGSRLEHSLRVSYYSYKISKALKLDYKETAKAGLLHDFFTKDDLTKKEQRLSAFYHPKIAVNNADDLFGLTDKEKNIIESHMFPMIPNKMPKYMESWIVSIVDKSVASYEFASAYGKIFKFKVQDATIILALFISRILWI